MRNGILRCLAVTLPLLLAGGLRTAAAEQVTAPRGTPVTLVFDQALSSKSAKVGDPVKFHVRDNVQAGNATVLAAGTPVTGVISKVERRKRYGVNATMRVALNPVSTPNGTITLEPRTQGKVVGGGKSDKAAAATAGGAIVAGPIGLVGGYFVHGKAVEIKPGDTFDTELATDTVVNR